jgi:hypothetical protein
VNLPLGTPIPPQNNIDTEEVWTYIHALIRIKMMIKLFEWLITLGALGYADTMALLRVL